MAGKNSLGAIHQSILTLLQGHPEGLTIQEIRKGLGNIEGQQHLDRRVRQLRAYYDVPCVSNKYILRGTLERPADDAPISAKLRSATLFKANGRCQMCGKTVKEDGIKLQADHKIPRTWGGATTEDNLWALCELCNNGKRDFFGSLDAGEMQEVVHLESVYERIAATLKLHQPRPVASWFLEFVANFDDFQEDWQKRLRELRYPVIGMKIKATRSKTPSGKWQAAYRLELWKPLPPNHKNLIKEHERKKRRARED